MKRIALFLVLVGSGALIVMASTSAETQDKCCFTHPSYSGTCEVAPGEDETCQSVLQYLNTPMSQGKTYCGGTELRGGWSSESCSEP